SIPARKSNRNRSCSSMLPSLPRPVSSVMWVMRRLPSLSRVWGMIRSAAAAIWSRIARTGRSVPALSNEVSLWASEPRAEGARHVAVDRRHRPVVAGVHRLQHVQRGPIADLTDDDAVGPHPQRVAHEVPYGHLTPTLDVGRARLQPQHVLLVQLQFGRVLDG